MEENNTNRTLQQLGTLYGFNTTRNGTLTHALRGEQAQIQAEAPWAYNDTANAIFGRGQRHQPLNFPYDGGAHQLDYVAEGYNVDYVVNKPTIKGINHGIIERCKDDVTLRQMQRLAYPAFYGDEADIVWYADKYGNSIRRRIYNDPYIIGQYPVYNITTKICGMHNSCRFGVIYSRGMARAYFQRFIDDPTSFVGDNAKIIYVDYVVDDDDLMPKLAVFYGAPVSSKNLANNNIDLIWIPQAISRYEFADVDKILPVRRHTLEG